MQQSQRLQRLESLAEESFKPKQTANEQQFHTNNKYIAGKNPR